MPCKEAQDYPLGRSPLSSIGAHGPPGPGWRAWWIEATSGKWGRALRTRREGTSAQTDRWLNARLERIGALVPYIKIAKREKLAQRLDKQEDYETLYAPEEIETLLTDLPSYHIDRRNARRA